MRTIPTWVEKVHNSSKVEQCIYDLCFHPDGSQLIVAAGQILLVYSCANGSVIQTLKGHKDNIYCVDYSFDGNKFASGGADKVVIIWSSKLEPILKYVHNDAIQCFAFNPVSGMLASCAMSDFSFWTLENKVVQKFKVASRITACSWNSDGQYLALGMVNGSISIRNVYGDEKYLIEKEDSNAAPIWALSFSPKKSDSDILCVTDWSHKLSFYSIDGKNIGRERNLGFEALSVNYMMKGDYILIAGCNKQCTLLSHDGIKLGTIGEEQESWIWCCKAHPSAPFVVFGCQDGTIAYFQLIFSTVHGLYREKYAFRENMTDVIVHHLITNEIVRIKCRDWVKKIAVYKHRLAVLLPSKIVVYELLTKDSNQMHYQIKEKLNKSLECNLLVVCSEHLIFCQEKRLQCYTFDGKNVAQWLMDDVVRYIKVVGGAAGNEGLIVGLADGQVLKIYISNPFPTLMMKSTSAILCLDLSLSKKKLAVVNDDNQCVVYDVGTDQIVHQESKATSVSWNLLYEDMLCYSGNDVLNIKVNDCQPHQMRFSGYVIGVYGSKVFSLNGSNIVTIDVPLSAPMYQCLERNLFEDAFMIASLGVTENDWRSLAQAALEKLDLNIAIKAYSRIKDLQCLDLIYEFLASKDQNREAFMGDILAYEGKFKEAGKMYQKAGCSHKALSMYTDMRMFDLAQEFVKSESNSDRKTLIRKKAEWAKNVNEPKAAAEMYLSAGDIAKAVDIAVENRWIDTLIDLGKKLDQSETEPLKKIADCLSKLDKPEYAIAIYNKLKDIPSVVQLHISMKNWSAAFTLVERNPEYENMLYIPYAQWLVENDNFVEAQKAFHKAGKPERATKVLEILIENAIDEGRFDDTGYYHWILSRQFLDLANQANSDEMIQKFYFHDRLANIYYAYNAIQKYLEEPFTSYQPEALFNIARYLLNEVKTGCPKGITRFAILYTLAKQAKSLGGFKIARQALDCIQNLRVPNNFQDFVDMSTIMIRAKPYHDNEELLIMCYRCSSYNPLVVSSASSAGNICLNCRQPFVSSFVTFDFLPLIEFQLEDGISDEEAIELLRSTSSESMTKQSTTSSQSDGNFQALFIDDSSQNSTDPFTATLINLEAENDRFNPVIVNRDTLLSMDINLVLICRWPKPLRYRYYRNLVPELQIIACSSCFKIFHIDDYEMEVLRKGCCPYCRVVPEKNTEIHEMAS
ncbi:intraflagellar transport protein 122 homolog [Planococcus citri]|uniref:intraflagellar transport protein 122 homolog n=1 Tax=Planococcus citri TaxID=170843 RepID=UPI0031F7B168